jgi:hypothetical protein
MIKTTAVGNGICVLGLIALLVGCASEYKKQEAAEGDIRMLQSEKASVAQQAAMGVSAVAPAGIVVGLVTGTEKTKGRVATGEYNKALDAKIAEIKSTCNLQ